MAPPVRPTRRPAALWRHLEPPCIVNGDGTWLSDHRIIMKSRSRVHCVMLMAAQKAPSLATSHSQYSLNA